MQIFILLWSFCSSVGSLNAVPDTCFRVGVVARSQAMMLYRIGVGGTDSVLPSFVWTRGAAKRGRNESCAYVRQTHFLNVRVVWFWRTSQYGQHRKIEGHWRFPFKL
jgi:hypothetical protein